MFSFVHDCLCPLCFQCCLFFCLQAYSRLFQLIKIKSSQTCYSLHTCSVILLLVAVPWKSNSSHFPYQCSHACVLVPVFTGTETPWLIFTISHLPWRPSSVWTCWQSLLKVNQCMKCLPGFPCHNTDNSSSIFCYSFSSSRSIFSCPNI